MIGLNPVTRAQTIMAALKLISATLYAIRIPFNVSFQHTTKARHKGESIVVRLTASDGTVGYGEGSPRSYVSGETLESTMEHIRDVLWPAVSIARLPEHSGPDLLESVDALLPDGEPTNGVIAHHSARCAVEVALLDLLTRRLGCSFSELLPPKLDRVQYSGAVTGGSPERSLKHAEMMKTLGFPHMKVKVGGEDTLERVQAIREQVGPEMGIRLDANEAWTPDEAISILTSLAPYDIEAVEQPVHRDETASLARVRQAVSVPLMVDESLITLDDAHMLITNQSCDYFNIRLSKCGGVARTLKMGRQALAAGLKLQLGSHVGETAILTAATRFMAAHLEEIRWVEGSWGPILLSADVSEERVCFEAGGSAPLLTGSGLGITVVEEQLAAHSESTVTLEAPG